MTIVALASFAVPGAAQSLLVGIPSADVAEAQHVELTHESQIGFGNPFKWNSFNFLCYGIGHNTEIAAAFLNIDSDGSQELTTGLGAKKWLPLPGAFGLQQPKLTLGANVFFSPKQAYVTGTRTGGWSYAHLSGRVPGLKTRLTAGGSFGTEQAFGYRRVGTTADGRGRYAPRRPFCFIGGIEQPISEHFTLLADWYSGTHALAAFIPAVQWDFGHQMLIVGYKRPNNAASGARALIVEVVIGFPASRKPPHE